MKTEKGRGESSTHVMGPMHGAKAGISASLVNIGGCEVEIEQDNTVVIL